MWIVRSKQILWAPKSSLHYRQKSSGQTASRPPSHWWWTSLGCNPLQQAQQLLQLPQQVVTMISRRNISSRWLFLAPSLVVFLLLFSLFSYVFAADGERIFGLRIIRDILLISLYFYCLYLQFGIKNLKFRYDIKMVKIKDKSCKKGVAPNDYRFWKPLFWIAHHNGCGCLLVPPFS